MALRVRNKRERTSHTSGKMHGYTRRAVRGLLGYLHASTFTLIHLYFLYSLLSPFMECVPPQLQRLPSSRAEFYHKVATFYSCAQLTATQVVPRIFFKEVVFRWKRGKTLVEAASNVWSKPSSALMLFGLAYFAMRGFLWAERVFWYTLRGTFHGLVWLCRMVGLVVGKLRSCCTRTRSNGGKNNKQVEQRSSSNAALKERLRRHADNSPDSAAVQLTLFRLLRKGNGYDTILRLALTACELVWLMQHIRLHHTLTSAAQKLTPAPTQPATWFASSLLLYLPTRLRTLTELHAVVTILCLTALLDVKRAFNLLIGVRPLWLINGWDCCPLCTEMWRHGSSRVHRCPRLFLPPQNHSTKAITLTSEDSKKERAEGTMAALQPRPGNIFPNADRVSKLSVFNYNWINSLLNVALISAFGDFGPPPSERFPDGGSQLWKAQRAVVRRLPPLPREFQTARSIDAPAWYLWRHRYDYGEQSSCLRNATQLDAEGVALQAAGLLPRHGILERFILYITGPLRRVLVHAFALFFLPSQNDSESEGKKDMKGVGVDGAGTTNHSSQRRWWMSWRKSRVKTSHADRVHPVRKPAGLFQLFLEHPSGREYIWTCVPMKVMQDAASIAAPTVVRSLVVFLREVSLRSTEKPRDQLGHGLFICLILTLVILAQSVIFQAYLRHLYGASMKASSALKCLILHHTLQTPIAYASRSEPTAKTTPAPTAATAAGDFAEQSTTSASHERKSQSLTTINTGSSSSAAATKEEKQRGGPEGASRRPSLEKAQSTTVAGTAANAAPGKDTTTASSNALMSHEGQVVTLLTVDCTNCGDCLVFLHNVWGHPVIILSALITMYRYVGWFATLTTFTVVLALTPLNRYFSSRVRLAQQDARNNTARISDLTSALPSMRTVKGMALESSLVERIERARDEESEGAARVGRAESIAVAQTEVMTLIISLVCCGSYLLSGGTMDAAVLVPTMAALNVMRFPLWTLPHVFSQVSRGYLSMKRIERYLNQDRHCVEQQEGAKEETQCEASTGHEVQLATNGNTMKKKEEGAPEATDGNENGSNALEHADTQCSTGQEALTLCSSLPKGSIVCAGNSFAWSAQAALHPHEPGSPLRATQHHRSGSTNGTTTTTTMALGSSAFAESSHKTNEALTGVVEKAKRHSTVTRRQSNDSAMLAMSLHSPNRALPNSSVVLHDVTLRIAPGEFVVIRGPTGSGKSALLLAMLGELYPLPHNNNSINLLDMTHSASTDVLARSGRIVEDTDKRRHRRKSVEKEEAEDVSHTHEMIDSIYNSDSNSDSASGFVLAGRVAFCGEYPWLRNQTIRENIRQRPDEWPETAAEAAWYSKVLYACALRDDLAAMPRADRTIVGENGAKLSGGQRARVALARAVYALPQCDIFLLDDVLSALDVEVQRHLITHLFHGLLRNGGNNSEERRETNVRCRRPALDDAASHSPSPNTMQLRAQAEDTALHGHGVTIVLSTHVATEMLQPDRILELQTDGTVREITEECKRQGSLAEKSRSRSAAQINIDSTKTTSNTAVAGGEEEEEEEDMSCGLASSSHSPCTSLGLTSGTEADRASASTHGQSSTQQRRRRRHRRNKNSSSKDDGGSSANGSHTTEKRGEVGKASQSQSNGGLITAVSREPKAVRFSLFPRKEDLTVLFYDYMGIGGVTLVVLTSLLMQTFRTFMDNWLGFWFSLHSTEAEKEIMKSRPVQHLRDLWVVLREGANVMQTLWAVSRPAPPPPPPPPPPPRGLLPWMRLHFMKTDKEDMVRPFLITYACIGILSAVFSLVRSRVFFRAYHRVANELHRHVIQRLFRAPVSYYDRVPSSTLLQVLSRDQQVVDHMLGQSIELVLLTVIQLVAVICFNALRYAAFIVVLPITAYLFYQLTMRFLVLIKQVRALEGKLSAQVVQVVKEALQGAVTIRAYGAETVQHIQSEMFDALDSLHTAAYICLTADRWVALRLELVSLAMTSTLSILAVLTACLKRREGHYRTAQLEHEAVSAEAVFAGLGIVSSITAARSLSLLCRRIGMFQNEFVSAESLLRLLREVPQEEPLTITAHANPDTSVDDNSVEQQTTTIDNNNDGELPLLDVRHLSAKYQPHLSYVLRDVSFTLRAGECVGLIGRTGNGKSSVFNALLQLMDCIEGEIRIPRSALPADGMTCDSDVSATVNALRSDVYALRRRFFQIVTQEPFLLQGTCRSNLQLGLVSSSSPNTTDTTVTTQAEGDSSVPAADRLLLDVLHKVSLDELLLSAWCGSPSLTSPTQAHFSIMSGNDASPPAMALPVKANEEETNECTQQQQVHGKEEMKTMSQLATVLPMPAEEKGVRTSVEDTAHVSVSNTINVTVSEGTSNTNSANGTDTQNNKEEETGEKPCEGPHEDNEDEKSAARQDSSSLSNEANVTAEDEEVERASLLLDHVIMAGGANLSAGQRQLLCLARALLHRPRVVLLDEVSSRVDARTEMVIQKVIEEEFLQRKRPMMGPAVPVSATPAVSPNGDTKSPSDASSTIAASRSPCGVLLIAHRLETILALCDRVLVIDHGRVAACLTKEQVSTLEDLQSYL